MSSGNEQRCEASGGRKRGFSDVDSSSSESSDDEVTIGPRRKCFMIDEEEADSDDSINVTRKRRVARMSSSSSSSDDSYDNSDAEVIHIVRKKNTFKLASSEDDSSGWEDESATKSSKEIEEGSSSDSCDGQSEKCPICFIKFRNQEVGIPATCEHCFCVGCIQEWSKSVNTCPVDRKKFNQIRVRKCYNNKDYYKTIPVEEPTNDTFDDLAGVIDLTACEVCGSSEHEDRLLLCDSCDAAYHLDCLTPPLREVPVGNWFCEGCGFGDASDLMNFDLVQFDFLVSSSRSTRESFTTSRLIPRTRQSERIRTRIVYQRGQRQNLPVANEAGNQASVNDINQPGPSTSTRRRPRTTNKKVTKRRKTRKTKPAKYKITYEIDQTTGEKIAIKKKTRKYMRKRKKARKSKIKFKRVVVPKSVKERLAKQLGMCAPKTPGQTLPDVKVQTNLNNNIAIRRSQAGLPSLHLFAPRNELEYFSESESEVDGEGGGVNILVARRPNRSDVSVLRRAARNKANVAITPIATASTDLLGSILNSQAQLHSKNSALSLKRDGTVKIDVNKNVRKDSSDRSNGAINLGGADSYVHRRPMVPNTSGNEGGSCNANMNSSHPCDNRISNTVPTSTVEFSNSETSNNFGSNDNNDDMQDYSMHGHLDNYEIPQNSKDKQKKKEDKEEKEVPNGSPGNSGSELDIYSDIETVSTSKIDEQEAKCPTPPPPNLTNANLYDDNESESDLIIDTEKAESDKYDPMTMYESEGETTKEEETVTSTSEPVNVTRRNDFTSPTLSSEIQSETVQSSNQNEYYLCKSFADEEEKHAECDNEEPSDDCPNFSIYSAESINLAKNSELNIMMAQNEAAKTAEIDETPPSPVKKDEEKAKTKVAKKPPLKKRVYTGLYSDSEDESLIKINQDQPFGFSDIRNMTEDISEEERSYTPCLDEKEPSSLREGLAGLDTELISDDEKNDFEETQEMKTASDGDALEINAKESELDFTRPDECEEGEIIDKSKTNVDESVPEEVEKESKSEVVNNEEIESENKEPVFKKLSKSNKERNYRDKENKERERSKSKEKKDNKSKDKEIREREMRENNRRERQRKEKRREIARYNVRSLVETKPKKDKFGRDPAQRRSRSNTRKRTPSSSRSPSPTLRNPRDDVRRKSQSVSSDSSSSRRYGKDMRRKSYSTSRSRSPLRRSVSRGRKSYSPDRRKRRGRTASRSKSRGRKPRSRSRLRKRPRSSSRDRVKPRKRSNDKAPDKLKRKRKRDRSESRSPSRRREWVGRRRSREWSLSMSHSRSPEAKHFTPSWTPPRMMNQTVRPQNLTVILPNDSNKKKKDKKKKQEKKIKESATGGAPEKQKKRRRSERSPLPSKEVFASGNNILVSVSFNKDNNEVRTEKVRRKRDSNASEDLSTRRVRKENNPVKTPVKRKQRGKNVSNIKPVAIIDLDRSPFKELTPSPKDIIVLSDSDNGDSNDLMGLQNALNQQSPQQAASPEAANNSSYMNSMGPKTPPEPQVKFTFSSKQPQLRAISNPLHDPDDDREEELDPQEELENRLNEVTHKGPNTPPEPPNSPPSSPDAYDPFDPTKSRTPSPEPKQSNAQSSISQIIEDSQEEIEDISESIDLTEKNSPLQVSKSHTPPISVADIQPADSQSSVRAITPDTNQGSSPERPERTIGVVINQVVQSQSASLFPSSTPIAYSSSSTSLITSTPVSSNLTVPRINILSSSILTPPVVTSSVSQRSLIPNTTKASPINKVSPSKAPAKSSASKGSSKIPTKNANWKNKNRSNENNDSTNLDLDSPYSPGSSDYEDLFEPPPETGKSAPTSKTSTAATTTASKTTSSGKGQNAFDVLFGTSPAYANKKPTKTKSKPKKSTHHTGKGTKQVGVKLDEDNLKILDELPNSAVEMQVKDKFLKKLNRQERVVEEVKFVLKPYYNKKRITKEEYKDILRRAVPKICHNKSGEINPQKIQQLIEAYVKKSKHSKKVTSSSSTVNPQKTEVVSNWLSKLN